ncbi:hypothetical protein JB92DRAFT_1304318 [Gautieria morchelliformis]|nr:hypothetical protein JB92DRAFT_1304318 [Gautieria morchelliformis]
MSLVTPSSSAISSGRLLSVPATLLTLHPASTHPRQPRLPPDLLRHGHCPVLPRLPPRSGWHPLTAPSLPPFPLAPRHGRPAHPHLAPQAFAPPARHRELHVLLPEELTDTRAPRRKTSPSGCPTDRVAADPAPSTCLSRAVTFVGLTTQTSTLSSSTSSFKVQQICICIYMDTQGVARPAAFHLVGCMTRQEPLTSSFWLKP